MGDLIFGKTWDEIQALQNKQSVVRPAPIGNELPQATNADRALLAEYGQAGLYGMGFFGVLDRLKNSGLLKNE